MLRNHANRIGGQETVTTQRVSWRGAVQQADVRQVGETLQPLKRIAAVELDGESVRIDRLRQGLQLVIHPLGWPSRPGNFPVGCHIAVVSIRSAS